MRIRIVILSLLVILASASCKSQYQLILESNDVETKYKEAFKLFEAKKYSKAAELFESLSIISSGLPIDDTVNFYWSYSNYLYKDYVTAEGNLDKFIETYPLSPFHEQAQFLRLDCLYRSTYRYTLDQKPTYKAMSAISQFVIENPSSKYADKCIEMNDDLQSRLEEKAYQGAFLYYHMEDYKAAHYALKNVLKENADNRFREEILYYTAMSAYKYALNSVAAKQRERYLVFVDDYFNIVSEYPDSARRRALDPLYKRVQKLLERNNQ